MATEVSLLAEDAHPPHGSIQHTVGVPPVETHNRRGVAGNYQIPSILSK
jgi:hypothetical protein